MTGFLTAIDENRDLSDGFVQNPDLTIWVNGSAYEFRYTGSDPNFIPNQVVCPLWADFCDALMGLNQAYATAILPEPWGEATCDDMGNVALDGTPDEGYIIGQVLRFVADGLSEIGQTYLPCTP
jgi:hypothetical protein